MPKPRRILDLNARHNLHECLQRKASMQLKTKSNCERLATKMRKENCAVSASTLYRIFLDSKSETRPFINTLNEIVKYLGFDDYDTFKKWSQKNTNIAYINDNDKTTKKPLESLLTINIAMANYEALRVYFDQFIDNPNDALLFPIGKEIYTASLKYPKSVDSFAANFSDHPVVRRAFFELYADPEFRIPSYSKAIQLYIENSYSTKYNLNAPEQAEIFGRTMLLKHAINKKSKKEVLRRGYNLYNSEKLSSDVVENVHFFPKVRYHFYKIVYLHFLEKSNQQRLFEQQVQDKCSQWVLSDKPENLRVLLHTILDIQEYLIDKDCFSDCIYAIKNLLKKEQFALDNLSKEEILELINPNASAFVNKPLYSFKHLA